MANRSISTPFSTKQQIISKEGNERLHQQVQYYFSLRNLITDHFLLNIINSSKGGWVDLEIISACNQVQRIFTNFYPKIGSGLKKMALRKSCSQSQVLEVSSDSVRRKGAVSIEDFSSVLYIEGDISVQQIKQILSDMGVSCDRIGIRQGKRWFFLEFFEKQTEAIKDICSGLIARPELADKCRILNGNQFVAFQKQYAQIVGILPLDTPITETEYKYPLPSNRIISYHQAQELKIGRKTKPIKPRGKHAQTRLPKRYIHVKKSSAPTEQHKIADGLIEIEGLDNKKKAKTAEEVRQYCRRKIKQRKDRKARRRQEGVMQVEELIARAQSG